MKTLIAMLTVFIGSFSQAETQPIRTGIASFSGIMVRVTVDQVHQRIKIGESDLAAVTSVTPFGVRMSAINRIRINMKAETLIVQVYLSGGKGGDPAEFPCENARLIVRRLPDADRAPMVEVKNECVYLE